jgi:hypothetical protein
MQVGDLVKDKAGLILGFGIIFETSTECWSVKVMFPNGASRWLRRDSLELVCK